MFRPKMIQNDSLWRMRKPEKKTNFEKISCFEGCDAYWMPKMHSGEV